MTLTTDHSLKLDDLLRAARLAVGNTPQREDHAWVALALFISDSSLPDWAEAAIPGLDHCLLQRAQEALQRGGYGNRGIDDRKLAAMFESYLARSDAGELTDRRNAGAYFTPPALVDYVV